MSRGRNTSVRTEATVDTDTETPRMAAARENARAEVMMMFTNAASQEFPRPNTAGEQRSTGRLLPDTQTALQRVQRSLPVLPNPALEETLQHYLTCLKPFLSKTEWAASEAVVQQFLQEDANALDEVLRGTRDNWFERWRRLSVWEGRHSLWFSLQPSVVFNMLPLPPPALGSRPPINTLLDSATRLLYGLLRLHHAVVREEWVPPRHGRPPSTAHAYPLLFNHTLTPQAECDSCDMYPSTRHITIHHDGTWWQLHTLHPVTHQPLTMLDIEDALLHVLSSRQRAPTTVVVPCGQTPAASAPGSPVGALHHHHHETRPRTSSTHSTSRQNSSDSVSLAASSILSHLPTLPPTTLTPAQRPGTGVTTTTSGTASSSMASSLQGTPRGPPSVDQFPPPQASESITGALTQESSLAVGETSAVLPSLSVSPPQGRLLAEREAGKSVASPSVVVGQQGGAGSRTTPGEARRRVHRPPEVSLEGMAAPDMELLSWMPREAWRKARELLVSSDINRALVEQIESAAFAVSLSTEAAVLPSDDPGETLASLRAPSGVWADKSLTLKVRGNGVAALTGEASQADYTHLHALAQAVWGIASGPNTAAEERQRRNHLWMQRQEEREEAMRKAEEERLREEERIRAEEERKEQEKRKKKPARPTSGGKARPPAVPKGKDTSGDEREEEEEEVVTTTAAADCKFPGPDLDADLRPPYPRPLPCHSGGLIGAMGSASAHKPSDPEEDPQQRVARTVHRYQRRTQWDAVVLPYGQRHLQALGISPDAFVVLGAQLAYFMQHGNPCVAVHAVSTHQYRDGTQHTYVPTVTPTTLDLCRVATGAAHRPHLPYEGYRLLLAACAEHVQMTQDLDSVLWYSHLMALDQVSQEQRTREAIARVHSASLKEDETNTRLRAAEREVERARRKERLKQQQAAEAAEIERVGPKHPASARGKREGMRREDSSAALRRAQQAQQAAPPEPPLVDADALRRDQSPRSKMLGCNRQSLDIKRNSVFADGGFRLLRHPLLYTFPVRAATHEGTFATGLGPPPARRGTTITYKVTTNGITCCLATYGQPGAATRYAKHLREAFHVLNDVYAIRGSEAPPPTLATRASCDGQRAQSPWSGLTHQARPVSAPSTVIGGSPLRLLRVGLSPSLSSNRSSPIPPRPDGTPNRLALRCGL